MLVRPDGIVKIERYWNPPVNPEFASSRTDDDYAQEFAGRFDDVVRRHLISDVPVGVPLSGGLDSSGVVSTMARLRSAGTDLHTQGLYTFSALYPGESIDESEYIHEVERAVGSIPHYAYPKLDDFWNEIDEWIWYQEEPTIASAPYAYYSVYRLASEHVKVMVSGNGGDELLAGYIPYFRTYLTSATRAAPLPRGRPRDRQGPRPLQEVRGRAHPHQAAPPARRTRSTPASCSGRDRPSRPRTSARTRTSTNGSRATCSSTRPPISCATRTRTRWRSRSRRGCPSSTTSSSSSSSRCRSTRRSRAVGTARCTATR